MEISEKIKALLGEEFKEDMKPEEILSVLNSKNLFDLSSGNYVSAAKYRDDVNAEKARATSLQKKLETKLTDDEKKAAEEEKKNAQFLAVQEELRKVKTEKVFAKAGYSEEQYESLAEKTTPEEAEAIVSLISKRESVLKKEIEDLKLKSMTDPQPGNSTKSKKKLSELSLDEQMKLKIENPQEYERLSQLGK